LLAVSFAAIMACLYVMSIAEQLAVIDKLSEGL
jgi:hypothetical protein